MRFKITADAIFEADDPNDALRRLRAFFSRAYKGKKDNLIKGGEIKIESIVEVSKPADGGTLKVNVKDTSGVGDAFGQ